MLPFGRYLRCRKMGRPAAVDTGMAAVPRSVRFPTRAIHPDGDAEARQALVDFSAYPARARSLGKPLPKSKGVSEGRESALAKAHSLEHAEPKRKSVVLRDENTIVSICFPENRRNFYFTEYDPAKNLTRSSITYGSRRRAMQVYRYNEIIWKKWRAL